jgi:hypothetical protein
VKVVVDVDRLTALLADRLAAVAPDGIRVEAGDGMLRFSAEPGRFPGQSGNYEVGRASSHVRSNFEIRAGTVADRLTGVCVQVLDELQDYVSEATHDPWPGRTAQPTPQAQIHQGELRLWYGGRHGRQVVLACAPIPLTGLGPAARGGPAGPDRPGRL